VYVATEMCTLTEMDGKQTFIIGRFENLTGQFKDVVDDRIDLNVYALTGNERFPRFYYDYGNHRQKVLEWLGKIRNCIENSSYPLPPLAIMDPPKAGKSALLRLLPHIILEIYPKSKIIHIDFAQFALNVISVCPLMAKRTNHCE
jgi:hypothetical protein